MTTFLPTGLVTFLFTDVEGSTSKWAADPDAMSASLRVHDAVMREAIAAHDGHVFTTAGDAFCVAFQRVSAAVSAATSAQRALAATGWPGPALRVRMGLHVGEAEERGGDYFGPTVNLAARVEAAAHGGQVLVTDAVLTAAPGLDTEDLGAHRLKDVPDAVRLHQLGPGQFPPPRATGGRSNLPMPANRILGRDDDIRRVRKLLDEHRLVTLAATGGTGKTRLALEVGDQELPHQPDGVWFADLTAADGERDVVLIVAAALGLELRENEGRAARVAGYLAGRHLLLILDNCEHVVEAVADLADAVLTAGGSSRILATSREWLDVDGEQVVRVMPLDADGAALRLFEERAVAVDDSFAVDDSNRADVAELCRRLDGIPLAIELAASRSAVMTPAELVAGLDDRFQLLSGGRRRQRRRTLEATIDWSHDLLDDEGRRVFRTLGVFAGGFDFDAVAAATGLRRADAIDAVEDLVMRSMVVADTGTRRFRLLETLKAYAEDRLRDAHEVDAARTAHLDHFLRRSAGIDTRLLRNVAATRDLAPDVSNLLQAAEWAAATDRVADLVELVETVTYIDWSAGRQVLDRFADAGPRLDGDHEVRLLSCESFVTMIEADWRRFADIAFRMLEIGDDITRAYAETNLAIIQGRIDPARTRRRVDAARAGFARHGGAYFGVTASVAEVHLACLSGDLDAATSAARSALRDDDPGDLMPHWWGALLVTLAVQAWWDADVDELRRLADEFDRVTVRGRQSGVLIMFSSDQLRALAGLSTDDGSLRRFVMRCAERHFEISDSDALIMLAEECRMQGDDDRARQLLRSTAAARSPAGELFGLLVGRRLGVEDELQAAFVANHRDRAWLIERPRAALRAEIARRGWGA